MLLNLLLRKVDLLMSTQADLVQAVADLDAAVVALENKPDSPGGVLDQATLDSTVTSLADLKARVDAETVKK